MFCRYQSVDEKVATSALSTLKRHLWYLAKETVVLSLWSNNVPTEVKDSIAEEILNKADFDNKISLGNPTFPELTPNMELASLVGKNSSAVFRVYGIEHDWLKADAIEWEKSTEFLKGKQIFEHLKVTNDCAERNIKLITDYSGNMVKDGDQRASLLQNVEHHRKQLSTFEKAKLVKFHEK